MLHNVMIIIISARASLFKVIEAIFSRVAAKSLYISRAVRNFYQIEFETKLIFAMRTLELVQPFFTSFGY